MYDSGAELGRVVAASGGDVEAAFLVNEAVHLFRSASEVTDAEGVCGP
jgi:hypothetical protein